MSLIERVNPQGDKLTLDSLTTEAQHALTDSGITDIQYGVMVTGGNADELTRHRVSSELNCASCILSEEILVESVPAEYKALCKGQPTETRNFSTDTDRTAKFVACTGGLFALADGVIEKTQLPITLRPYSSKKFKKS